MTSKAAWLLTLCCVAPVTMHGQIVRPMPRDTLTKRATADSLRVLKQLDARTRTAPNDADAWYHRGTVAALVAKRGQERHFPLGLTRLELDAIAAKSLREAVARDSTNARYWYEISKYYTTGTSEEFRQRNDVVERVIRLSRAAHDTTILIKSLMQLASGKYADWYRRDQSVDQTPSRFPLTVEQPAPVVDSVRRPTRAEAQLATASAQTGSAAWDRPLSSVAHAAGKDSVKAIADVLKVASEYVTTHVSRVVRTGATDASRREAERLLEEAFALGAENDSVFARLATLYAAGGDWPRLSVAARTQTRRTPRDAMAWMALGLAQHRQRVNSGAAAFATALVWMQPAVRERLDRLDRLLTWYDSGQFASATAAARETAATQLWQFADPLWSVDDGNPRQEFLARLAYAELRWPRPVERFEDEDVKVSGVDTHRGDLYVRYGPPNAVRGSFWMYDAGLIFMPGPGARPIRAREGLEYYETTERTEDWQPSRWDNVTLMRVDSMPVQVARFRADADSVDVFLAARSSLITESDSSGHAAKPVSAVWIVDRASGLKSVLSAPVDTAGLMRLAPRVHNGTYYYRAETSAPRLGTATRASGNVVATRDTATGFATRGFGISDPVLATNVVANAPTRRWRDVEITPLLGDVVQGSALSVVWENYELGERDGTAVYAVKLVLERKHQMFLNRVRARVISAWTAMLGSEQTPDRIIFRYDRTVPHATALADVVTVALEDTPAGNYELSIEITDKVTGKLTYRTVRVVIA